MNAVTINLLPRGNSLYTGPVIGDYIKSIFTLQTQLPVVVIYCPISDSILPLTSVLHDAPKTFL